MADKWKPQARTEAAIVKLEEQMPESQLMEYGTPEHLAVIRYGAVAIVEEVLADAKIAPDAKAKAINAALREWFTQESAFLGYASNAKKMLIEFGSMDAKAKKPTRGYE